VDLAPPGEPGDRLVVSGTVLRRAGSVPLPGVTVYVYHADSKGYYARTGEERWGPRLCGILRTDERGRYRIHTVVPFNGPGEGPHIHFETWGRGVTRQASVLYLSADETPPGTASSVGALPRWPDSALGFKGMQRLMAAGPPRAVMPRDSGGVFQCAWNIILN
jgi:protocatechuate 3,4-dioxygenase beta subunit